MPRTRNGDCEIEYEVCGDGPETVLLVNGLGSQMTRWPLGFCERLNARGYRAIRFDNRDAGLSTWFKDGDRYSLDDMARDAVAVLDAVGAGKVHVAGVSMGGMIAQTVAINHPDRVLSLTSIMSATGAPGSLDATPEANAVLVQPAPDPEADFEAFLVHALANSRTIGSPAYPWTDEELRERATAEYRRGHNPKGRQRQMGAIRAHGDRTAKLKQLRIPVVVLHGAEDPLIKVGAGEATAAAIPGAELRIIEGMGHDMPQALWDAFVDAIDAAARRARTAA